ncbi:hypothetical protein [Yoonia sp. SDW83-1]|uniref:hypothetical protein n=1 Tax=Yoonia sp. SDW83-1 TaxID=3366945 RepID=UPI00398C4641
MRFTSFTLAALAAVSLSACDALTTDPNNIAFAFNPDDDGTSLNTTTFFRDRGERIVITPNKNGDITLLSDRSFDKGQIESLSTIDDSSLAFVIRTDDSSAIVAVGRDPTGQAYVGSVVGRYAEVVMPETGNINFQGDYAGFLRNNETDQVVRFVNGTAVVVAQFAANETYGAILNRELRFTDDNSLDTILTLENITLEPTAIDGNGQFAGNATGGEILDGTTTGASRYGGYVSGGAAADEIIGAVIMEHGGVGTLDLTETGIFIAKR